MIIDYVFYSIYKSISVTNKLWPKKSTIGAVSILLLFNIVSALSYFEFDFKKNKVLFFVVSGLIFGVAHIYFYQRGKLKSIIEKFDGLNNKKFIIYDFFVLIYACLSIFLLFYCLGINYNNSFILIGMILLSSFISYLKRVRFD